MPTVLDHLVWERKTYVNQFPRFDLRRTSGDAVDADADTDADADGESGVALLRRFSPPAADMLLIKMIAQMPQWRRGRWAGAQSFVLWQVKIALRVLRRLFGLCYCCCCCTRLLTQKKLRHIGNWVRSLRGAAALSPGTCKIM